jgi:hypothetical protein
VSRFYWVGGFCQHQRRLAIDALTFSYMRSVRSVPRREDPFREGTIKRIHVNQHVIRRNAKTGEAAPPLSVKTSRGSTPCDHVVIHGDSVVRYSPDDPLSCGARVWIETRARLTLRGAEAAR